MATQDSNIQLTLVPSAAVVSVPPGAAPSGAKAPRQIPVFDILSSGALPALPQTRLPTLQELAGDDVAGRRAGSLWLAGDALMCACPDCRAPMTVRTWLMVADCWNCGASIELSEEQEREARRLLRERKAGDVNAAPVSGGSAAANTPANAPSHENALQSAAADATTTQKPAWDTQATRPMPRPPRRDPSQSPPKAEAPAASPAAKRQRPAGPQAELNGNGKSPSIKQPPSVKQNWAAEGALGQPRDAGPAAREAAPAATLPASARRARTPAAVADTRRRIRRLAAVSHVHAWLSDLLRTTPAWLISLVLHFVALTVLALIPMPGEDDDRSIVLSLAVSKDRDEGQPATVQPQNEVQFDLPVPKNIDTNNESEMQALIRADQDARELRVDPDAVEPLRPALDDVKSQIGSPEAHRTLAARDPRVRVELVEKEGGTTLSEAAVARALRWLALQQNDDGGWSLRGSASDEAATSLALLPFLGAGQSHLNGIYTDEVSAGLRWLVDHQADDGDLRHRMRGTNEGMYAHGQGAIVLCEAFALEGDERLRAPAQKAIDFIVAAQHSAGGWRYQPGQPGDTSVLGWQLMALQSARVAGLTVPDSTFELADQYLDTVEIQGRDGVSYSYQPRGARPSPAMTAEALLCRMYNGWTLERPQLREGVSWLTKNHLPDNGQPNLYYWYYGTQVYHHVGGVEWDRWNDRMRDILVRSQTIEGANAGSWPVRGPHDNAGGRIYTTSLSACTLEIYYRHLPIFRQIDLD